MIRNPKFAKVVATAAGLSMAFSTILPASAVTIEELQAQIAALMAQLSGLQGSGTVSVTFTRDLTVGSTGADVTSLQQWLVSKGYLMMPSGTAYGYFGLLTKAAVARWQAAVGLPSTGYFGPMSRAKISVTGGTTTGGTTGGNGGSTSGSLQGGEGSLGNFDQLGGVESTVDEGENGVKVLGIEFEAEDSDLSVSRVDVEIDLSGVTGNASSNIEQYIDSVSLWMNGSKIATMDAGAGDEDDDIFTYRFSGLNGIVREDATATLYVSVDAVSSIDSDEADEDITVSIPDDGIRAVDAAGISDTYGDGYSETFTVGEEEAGALTVSESSSNPDARNVQVDEDDNTNGVTMLVFELEAEDQDITVDEIPVTLGVSSGLVQNTFSTVYLYKGSTLLDSKNVGAGGTTTTFDDLDLTIDADDTETFTIKADINNIGTGFASGQYASTTISSTNADNIDAEDEAGDSLSASDISGSASGEVVTFVTEGIMVTAVSATSVDSALGTSGSEQGDFTIVFDVKAFEADQYIYKGASNASSTDAGAIYTLYQDGTASTTLVSAGFATDNLEAAGDTSGDSSDYFLVKEGETRRFTLKINLNPTTTGYYKAELEAVRYDASEDNSAVDDSTYTAPDTSNFETSSVQVNG